MLINVPKYQKWRLFGQTEKNPRSIIQPSALFNIDSDMEFGFLLKNI